MENTLKLTAGAAMVGVFGHGVSKVGVIGYHRVIKPTAHAIVDSLDFIKFNAYFQQELANVGKEIMYKRISVLRHRIKPSEDKIHVAITGALG